MQWARPETCVGQHDMPRTLLARPGPSHTSPRTSSVRPPTRSRPHVLPRRRARARPQGDSNASGSATSSQRRFASSYLTTSGCGTTSAGRCLTAEQILPVICCGLPTSTGPRAIASSMSVKVISLPGGVVTWPVEERHHLLVDRPVALPGLLGGVGEEEETSAGTDVGVPRIVSVPHVLGAVVVDEHLVAGAWLDRVGAEQRVAPL